MLRFKRDKDMYEIEEVTKSIISGERQVNRQAATLVLVCAIKLFDLLIPHLDKILDYLQ
jgi:hypothetical protein